MKSKTLATLGDGPHAAYISRLVERVAENARDGGAPAQVAALAVRGIVHTTGTEWAVLVETYGIPTTHDWQLAQRAYGPTANLPGLTGLGSIGATAECLVEGCPTAWHHPGHPHTCPNGVPATGIATFDGVAVEMHNEGPKAGLPVAHPYMVPAPPCPECGGPADTGAGHDCE